MKSKKERGLAAQMGKIVFLGLCICALAAIPPAEAAVQKSFVLDTIDNKSFDFEEQLFNETTVPEKIEFRSSNDTIVRTVILPKDITSIIGMIKIQTLNFYNHSVICKSTCKNMENCIAASPPKYTNWNCTYNVSMSIPHMPARGCNTPSPTMNGSYYYGKISAKNASCELYSGCTCDSYGPASCISGNYQCQPGESIQTDWYLDTNTGILRRPAIYQSFWRMRDGWECYDSGLSRDPHAEITGAVKSASMEFSYEPEWRLSQSSENLLSCQDTPETEKRTKILIANPVVKAGNFTVIERQNASVSFCGTMFSAFLKKCNQSFCAFEMTFASNKTGLIEIINFSMPYRYSPKLSNTTRFYNYTIIRPNESYYAANKTTLGNSALDILIQKIRIANNSTHCWLNGIEKQVVVQGSNTLCNIGEMRLQNNSELEFLIWTDKNEKVFEANETPFAIVHNNTTFFVGENLTVEKNVTVRNNDKTTATNLSYELENTGNERGFYIYNKNITGLQEKDRTVLWDFTINNSTTDTFVVRALAQSPTFSRRDNNATQNGTDYKYNAEVLIPADFTADLEMRAKIPVEALDDWDKRSNETIAVNDQPAKFFLEGNFIEVEIARNYQIKKQLVESEEDEKYAVTVIYELPEEKGEGTSAPEVPDTGDTGDDTGGITGDESTPAGSEITEGSTGTTGGSGGGGSSSPRTAKKAPAVAQKQTGAEPEQKTAPAQEAEQAALLQSKSVEIPDTTETTPKTAAVTGFVSFMQLKTRTAKILAGVAGALLLLAVLAMRLDYRKILPIHIPGIKTQSGGGEPEPELNTHMKTVLKGLSGREQDILKALAGFDGKTTQAKIYHAIAMPTTSLSRWMDKLEQKGLVASTRRGKLRVVELTDKFKGNTKQA